MGVAAALDLQHRPGVYGRSAGASMVPGSNLSGRRHLSSRAETPEVWRRGSKGEAKKEMGQETHHA